MALTLQFFLHRYDLQRTRVNYQNTTSSSASNNIQKILPGDFKGKMNLSPSPSVPAPGFLPLCCWNKCRPSESPWAPRADVGLRRFPLQPPLWPHLSPNTMLSHQGGVSFYICTLSSVQEDSILSVKEGSFLQCSWWLVLRFYSLGVIVFPSAMS
jgi:hypothetical protein